MPTTETEKELDAVLKYSERVGSKPAENNSIKRAKDILLSAEATWPIIAEEEGGLKEALLPYMVVIGFIPGLIGAVLSVALWGTIGAMLTGTPPVSSMTSMVFGSVIHLAYELVGILVGGKIVELIAPSFGLRKSWVLSTRAIVYGSTPAYVGSMIFWIPVLGWLAAIVCMIWSILLTIRGFKALLAKPVKSTTENPVGKTEVRERELASV